MRSMFYAGLLADDRMLSEAFGREVSMKVLDKMVYSRIVYEALTDTGEKFDRKKVKPWMPLSRNTSVGRMAGTLCEPYGTVWISFKRLRDAGLVYEGEVACPAGIVCGTMFPVETDNDVPAVSKLMHGYLNFLSNVFPHLSIKRRTLCSQLSMSLSQVDYGLKAMYAARLARRTYENGMPEIVPVPLRPEPKKKTRKGIPEDINDYRPF